MSYGAAAVYHLFFFFFPQCPSGIWSILDFIITVTHVRLRLVPRMTHLKVNVIHEFQSFSPTRLAMAVIFPNQFVLSQGKGVW